MDDAGSGDGGSGRKPFRAADRLALFPARAAARASRTQIESAADEHLVPELSRLADLALGSELPEEIARSIADHHVLERIGAELARNGALDAAVDQALASERTEAIVERIVHSDAVQKAIKDVVSGPELREALAEQTVGVFDELVAEVSTTAAELDDRVERLVRRRALVGATPFAGLVSRGLAFGLDLFAIALGFAVVAAGVALISYLVGGLGPGWVKDALAGGGFLVIGWGYFVVFWTVAGRTLGMHLLRLRVRDHAGRNPGFGRSVVRGVATFISILLLFLGYVTVLFDARRRGVPDLVAGTEVVYSDRIA